MSKQGDKQMQLRQYIAGQLERKQISQKDFADALGRDKSTVSNWLNGKYGIPIDALDDIAEVLEEKTSFRLYKMAGLFAKKSEAALIDVLQGETPENVELIARVAAALLKKENH